MTFLVARIKTTWRRGSKAARDAIINYSMYVFFWHKNFTLRVTFFGKSLDWHFPSHISLLLSFLIIVLKNQKTKVMKLKSTLKLFHLNPNRKHLQYNLNILRSQIEGYTRLLIFGKFSTLPAIIWASLFINFQDNFQPPCFFTYTNEKFSTLPAVIRAYPFI